MTDRRLNIELPMPGGSDPVAVRELAGVLLLGERLIVHSTYRYEAASSAFHRFLELVEGPGLSGAVDRICRSHGSEEVRFKGGQRVLFRARTGAERGLAPDLLILDEAHVLSDEDRAVAMVSIARVPGAQVWVVST